MKTRFPKLQGFLIKPLKPAKADDKKKDKKPALNLSTAFVYKGHIVASDLKITIFFNLKEYLKHFLINEKDEDPKNSQAIITNLVERLEGKTLSKEFFDVFSKLTTIVKADQYKIYVENGGLHSEYSIESEFDVELLEDFLSKTKVQWEIERSEQGDFGVSGVTYSALESILKTEMAGDSIVFKRTADDKANFCLIRKEFVFGICPYSLETESSITKFGEANDFFEINVSR